MGNKIPRVEAIRVLDRVRLMDLITDILGCSMATYHGLPQNHDIV